MHNLKRLKSWKSLKKHYNEVKKISLNNLFNEDKRFNKYSIEANKMLVDFSKNHINDETLLLFKKLLKEINIRKKINNFFEGKKINLTENRSAMHYLLRCTFTKSNENIYQKNVKKSLQKIKKFSNKVNSNNLLGFSKKKIKYVINIGIG